MLRLDPPQQNKEKHAGCEHESSATIPEAMKETVKLTEGNEQHTRQHWNRPLTYKKGFTKFIAA